MKKHTNTIVLILALLLAGNLFAQETFSHPDAGVDITVPAGWFYELDEESMTITTEDETLALVFSVIGGGSLDAALDEVDAMLYDEFSEVSLGEAESTEINGLSMIFISGQADGLEVTIGVIDTPTGQYMLVSGFAAAETLETYAADVQAIFGNLAPSN